MSAQEFGVKPANASGTVKGYAFESEKAYFDGALDSELYFTNNTIRAQSQDGKAILHIELIVGTRDFQVGLNPLYYDDNVTFILKDGAHDQPVRANGSLHLDEYDPGKTLKGRTTFNFERNGVRNDVNLNLDLKRTSS